MRKIPKRRTLMKKLIGTLAAGAILVGAAAPAAADTPPAGGCPTGWTLTAIADIPAVGQPGAYAIDQRGTTRTIRASRSTASTTGSRGPERTRTH
jgi:hypothetical protein